MKGIKQIKNYRLIQEIGKGATGTVYEAVDDNTNKKVAVKSIPNTILANGRGMENMKRELRILHQLNHNNIIKISGLEKTANNTYLILEYCNGGNLYEYSTFFKSTYKTPIPEQIVQKILRQLINGLEYMHINKIVHRDIKLENVLINFDDVSNTVIKGQENKSKVDYKNLDFNNITIKIADLGYARELGVSGVTTTICGTPISMAPDIINLFDNNNKDQKYNSKVDLWSLGTITYELLVGTPPFYASNYVDLFKDVMKGVYNLPKNLRISIEAISFINGLLQFFSEKRFGWSDIKRHPFIVNDFKNFHFIDLRTVETNYNNPEQLQIDTKDCENFVWLLFKTNVKNLPLDRVDQSIYQNPILEQIIKPNEDNKDLSEEYEDANELDLGDPSEHHHVTKEQKDEKNENDDIIKNDLNKDDFNEEVLDLKIEINEEKKLIHDKVDNLKQILVEEIKPLEENNPEDKNKIVELVDNIIIAEKNENTELDVEEQMKPNIQDLHKSLLKPEQQTENIIEVIPQIQIHEVESKSQEEDKSEEEILIKKQSYQEIESKSDEKDKIKLDEINDIIFKEPFEHKSDEKINPVVEVNAVEEVKPDLNMDIEINPIEDIIKSTNEIKPIDIIKINDENIQSNDNLKREIDEDKFINNDIQKDKEINSTDVVQEFKNEEQRNNNESILPSEVSPNNINCENNKNRLTVTISNLSNTPERTNKYINPSLTYEYLQMENQTKAEAEEDEDLWEIISTKSIIEEKIQSEILDEYEMITEYFK